MPLKRSYYSLFLPLVPLVFLTMLVPLLLRRFLPLSLPFSRSTHSQLSRPPLTLNSKAEFHIAIFSDLHYGEEENGWGIEQDVNSARVMRNVLRDEEPDLVVLNGDLITGENTFLSNSTLYLNTIVQPLLESHTPWASTYGNHDCAFNLSPSALFFQESLHPLSYTQHSPPSIPGITNYYLSIYSPSNPTTPAVVLYFFDSRGGIPFQEPPTPENAIPNWVTSPIVSWFLTTSLSLTSQYGKEIPSLAFVHIPPTKYLDFQSGELGGIGDEDARFPGLNDDEVVHQGSGWGEEGESGGLDEGFMDALKEVGVHSLYVGHDHGDAWCGSTPFSSSSKSNTNPKFSKSRREQKKGPFLCFSKHTGYGGYGSWNRGSRNIRISFNEDEEIEVETWVRMENGDVIQKVSLNSTYGVDIYSIEDGE